MMAVKVKWLIARLLWANDGDPKKAKAYVEDALAKAKRYVPNDPWIPLYEATLKELRQCASNKD